MSGLKNFERIEKKRYPYKMRQVLLDDEQEFLFEYEEIRPKKTPKPKRSYDEVFTTAIKEYAKTFISQIETSTLNSNVKTNSKKQVVIKNIGNMTQLHTNKAMDYIAKNGELVRDEFFRWIDYDIVANDWNADFTELRSKNPRLKNMAMHLVFSLDENLHPSNLAILELSVYNSLIDTLGYDYPFIMKLHTHQNKPHAHVIINKTHKFTGKQLRFTNKQHVREFFFQLRESFQDQLYIHSHGRLNYSNEPNIQKRIAGINEELSKLISQGQEQFTQNFNHNEFFDKAYDDAHMEMKLLASVKNKELGKLDFIKIKIITSKAIELLEENFEIDDEHMVWLEKFLEEKSTKPDLKELSILRKGTYKKVMENNYHINNFEKALRNKKTSFLEKQRLNALKQKALAFNEFFKELQNFYNSVKKIHRLEQKINALNKACSNYINIPNKFHALNRGYHAVVQKRKAYELLKPLQHHGANKTMTKNLILLEKEIKEHNNDTKNALGIVYSYLSYSQLALNDKTNSFALNRHLKYLNNIALIASDTLRAENVSETNHSCIELLKNLAQRENETMELLEKRKNFCIERKGRLQIEILECEDNGKKLARLKKSLQFLEKELELQKSVSKGVDKITLRVLQEMVSLQNTQKSQQEVSKITEPQHNLKQCSRDNEFER